MNRLKAYIVDDEPLAVTRLENLLAQLESVEVVGHASDPAVALKFLLSNAVDLLFLDIQMPGMSGFDLLSKLEKEPPVIFTTAFGDYALKAFEVNSIDYLLKPIGFAQLKRAVDKIKQFRNSDITTSRLESMLANLAAEISPPQTGPPSRIGTRIGDRIKYIELNKITRFFSEDKLTFAATAEGKNHIVDYTITELERRLSAGDFVRIHRSTLVNLRFVNELHRWFGGKMLIRMNDQNRTELKVAREKTAILKQRLGL